MRGAATINPNTGDMDPRLAKTMQAAAVLLREAHGQSMSYMRLIKLLYIVDREALAERGRPVTGDRYVAMQHGPVLSDTLNAIKGMSLDSPSWCQFIQRQDFDVLLAHDPGNADLSRYEIRKIQEVAARYANRDQWELVELTHTFDEWKRNDPGSSSRPIQIVDVLKAMNVPEQDAAEIARDLEQEERLRRLGESERAKHGC